MKYLYMICIALLLSPVVVLADEPVVPPPNPGDQQGPDPIPVDGGATLLLTAGAFYAYKKMKTGQPA